MQLLLNPSTTYRHTQYVALCLVFVSLGCNKEEPRGASVRSPTFLNDGDSTYKDASIPQFQISFQDLPDLLGKPYSYHAPPPTHQYEVVDCQDGWVKYTPAPIEIQPTLKHTYLVGLTLYTLHERVEIIHFSPKRIEIEKNSPFMDKLFKRKQYELLQLTSRFSECESSSPNHTDSKIECEKYSATLFPVEIILNRCGEHTSFEDWKSCFKSILRAPSSSLIASPTCAGCYGYQLIYYRDKATFDHFIKMIYTQQKHKEDVSQGPEMPPNEPYDTCGEHFYQ